MRPDDAPVWVGEDEGAAAGGGGGGGGGAGPPAMVSSEFPRVLLRG